MNKKIYLLLPFCLTLLPACSSSYTLTLVNSDPEAGTILTEGGKFKTGEVIKIQAETFQGYKIDKWIDSTSGKIGSRDEFNFTMPNRNAELTVYYEYDDFKINCNQKINADDSHYDFSDFDEYYTFGSYGIFTINDGDDCFTNCTYEATWKDTVDIVYKYTYSDSWWSFKQISDEEGNKLGDTSYSFEMPNHDTSLTFEYESIVRSVKVSTNYPNVSYSISYTGLSNASIHRKTVDNYDTMNIIFADSITSYSICMSIYNEEYVFDHWLDLDTNETLTTDRWLKVSEFSGNNHYQAVLREA